MIKSAARYAVCAIPALHNFYLENFQIEPQKRSLKLRLDELRSAGCDIATPSSARFTPRPEQTVCHIIGSGWSLNRSIHLAKEKNAFVVGINNSALAKLKYDAYFVEFAGASVLELSIQQSTLVRKYVFPDGGRIYFKNINKSYNDVPTYLRLWSGCSTILPDVELRCIHSLGLEEVCRSLLTDDHQAVRQCVSSIFTAIGIGLFSGFKTIVLHGVDFGGAYFFDEDCFDGPKDLRPPSTKDFYSRDDIKRHVTNAPGVGVASMLPIVSRLLRERNVELLAANKESPSAAILGWYKTK